VRAHHPREIGAPEIALSDSAPNLATDDVALATRVRQSDHDAFQSLYERYGGAVLGLAHSIVHDRTSAEDITHDVFLGFWKNPHAFEPSRGQFVAWLLRVTRNRAIDLLRRRRDVTFANARPTADGEAADPTQWIVDPDPTPETEAVARSLADDVRAALATLPPEHRMLLEMAYFGGLTQREIAERVKRPLGTVKTQMRTSLMKLGRLANVRALAQSATEGQSVSDRGSGPEAWSLMSARASESVDPDAPQVSG
jgi:RNA polymerase sigma-70 factor (ECF subfamily)